MSVKDDPASRLKAADARALFEGETRDTRLERLNALIEQRRLKAAGFLLFLEGFTGWLAAAPVIEDAGVIKDYMRGWHGVLTPEQREQHGLLLLGVRDDGVIDLATWGADAGQCALVGRMAAEHPLPAAPFQTWFGWGNGGRPKALTEAELASLTAHHRALVLTYTHPQAEH